MATVTGVIDGLFRENNANEYEITILAIHVWNF